MELARKGEAKRESSILCNLFGMFPSDELHIVGNLD